LKQGVSWADICIRNMSSRGLLVQGRSPPDPGTYVEVRRGEHIIVARVVWSNGQEFGLQTQDQLHIDAILQDPNGANGATVTGAGERVERRAVPRTPTSQQAHDFSRHLASAMQFGFLLVLSLSLAGVAFAAVRDALATPLRAATDML